MPTNARKQNKHTPYRLILDGKEYGCYEDDRTARNIGRSMMEARKAYSYRVFDADQLVDSSD